MDHDDSETDPPGLLDRASAISSNALMTIACVGITLMMLHVTADVAGKYLLSVPVEATYETVEIYYMVALVFLPFTYIARGEGHIFVELFTRNLSDRGRHALDGAIGILTLIWVCLLAWYAGEEAVTTTLDNELRETAEGFLLVWPSRWFVPFGCGVMAFAVLLKIAEDFGKAVGGRRAGQE